MKSGEHQTKSTSPNPIHKARRIPLTKPQTQATTLTGFWFLGSIGLWVWSCMVCVVGFVFAALCWSVGLVLGLGNRFLVLMFAALFCGFVVGLQVKFSQNKSENPGTSQSHKTSPQPNPKPQSSCAKPRRLGLFWEPHSTRRTCGKGLALHHSMQNILIILP